LRFTFAQDRLDARDVLARLADHAGILELIRRDLHAVGEEILQHGGPERLEVVARALAQILGLHHSLPRARNRVSSGSFAAASRQASRASLSETPEISNRTRPGLTTATQPSTLPLPLPMRTSRGFLVMGLSGKIRIQSLPARLT